MTLADVLDAAILVWLVGTWFFEGHHRRCVVLTKCDGCGDVREHQCESSK